jgi:hypothetical protein
MYIDIQGNEEDKQQTKCDESSQENEDGSHGNVDSSY